MGRINRVYITRARGNQGTWKQGGNPRAASGITMNFVPRWEAKSIAGPAGSIRDSCCGDRRLCSMPSLPLLDISLPSLPNWISLRHLHLVGEYSAKSSILPRSSMRPSSINMAGGVSGNTTLPLIVILFEVGTLGAGSRHHVTLSIKALNNACWFPGNTVLSMVVYIVASWNIRRYSFKNRLLLVPQKDFLVKVVKLAETSVTRMRLKAMEEVGGSWYHLPASLPSAQAMFETHRDEPLSKVRYCVP